MTTIVAPGEATAAMAELSAALRTYRDAVDLTRLSDADLVAELRGLETLRRVLSSTDHPVIAELDRRGIGVACGARSTAGLLQATLRLSPREARARTAAALALGPRASVTGEQLAPLLPEAAAASRDGDIGDEHTARILHAITNLPARLSAEDRATAEQILTDVARHAAPADVAAAGERLLDTVDPDGDEPDDARHEPTRGLTLHRRRDGSYQLSGRLTPECGIQAEAVFNVYGQPRPTVNADNGASIPDLRTPTQRRHDALHDLTGLALRADTLEHTGRRAELVIIATAAPDAPSPAEDTAPAPADDKARPDPTADTAGPEPAPDGAPQTPDLHTRLQTALLRLANHAHTSTGRRLTLRTATRLCDTAQLATITVTTTGQPLNHGRTRRYATKAQLRVLIARDRGCSFPGCDHPPQWCDAHHIIEWINDGPTDIENLTLLCGYHHRVFARLGWTCSVVKGIPYWSPPAHIDPLRKPIRNHAHLLR